MKKTTNLLAILFLMVNTVMFAQIRVNESPQILSGTSSTFIDASSSVVSNIAPNIGKGLLFPRTDLSKFTSFAGIGVGTPASYPYFYDGFVVYNTTVGGKAGVGATEGELTNGLWYYDNKTRTINGGTWKAVNGDSTNNQTNQGLTYLGSQNIESLQFPDFPYTYWPNDTSGGRVIYPLNPNPVEILAVARPLVVPSGASNNLVKIKYSCMARVGGPNLANPYSATAKASYGGTLSLRVRVYNAATGALVAEQINNSSYSFFGHQNFYFLNNNLEKNFTLPPGNYNVKLFAVDMYSYATIADHRLPYNIKNIDMSMDVYSKN